MHIYKQTNKHKHTHTHTSWPQCIACESPAPSASTDSKQHQSAFAASQPSSLQPAPSTFSLFGSATTSQGQDAQIPASRFVFGTQQSVNQTSTWPSDTRVQPGVSTPFKFGVQAQSDDAHTGQQGQQTGGSIFSGSSDFKFGTSTSLSTSGNAPQSGAASSESQYSGGTLPGSGFHFAMSAPGGGSTALRAKSSSEQGVHAQSGISGTDTFGGTAGFQFGAPAVQGSSGDATQSADESSASKGSLQSDGMFGQGSMQQKDQSSVTRPGPRHGGTGMQQMDGRAAPLSSVSLSSVMGLSRSPYADSGATEAATMQQQRLPRVRGTRSCLDWCIIHTIRLFRIRVLLLHSWLADLMCFQDLPGGPPYRA
jgi:hypothetical protein